MFKRILVNTNCLFIVLKKNISKICFKRQLHQNTMKRNTVADLVKFLSVFKIDTHLQDEERKRMGQIIQDLFARVLAPIFNPA